MWPFDRKPAKARAGQSFQEFRKTYMRPVAPPIKDPIQEETVCPLCFTLFAAGTVSAKYPSCPDCSSEGMDFGVEPLAKFLAGKAPEDFDEIAKRWQAATGFYPQYKAAKLERIAQLKARKLAAR